MNSSEIQNAEDKNQKDRIFFFTCSKRIRKGHLPKRQLKWNYFSNYKIKECLLEESVIIKCAKKEKRLKCMEDLIRAKINCVSYRL